MAPPLSGRPCWPGPPCCPLSLPRGQLSQGSNLPFLVLNFGVWRPVMSPFSPPPRGLCSTVSCSGSSSRPCRQSSLAWSPTGQTGYCPRVLGSPESAQLPSGQAQGCVRLHLPWLPLSSPVLCPVHVAPWRCISPSLPAPWSQHRQPAPTERGLFPGLTEHHLPLLPNWSYSRLSEGFMKSSMCIFPSGSP